MTEEQAFAGGKLSVPEGEGLQRRLSQRQLTMMAIGGAIGVGLFLGSSVTIRLAGPAVIDQRAVPMHTSDHPFAVWLPRLVR